MRYRETTGSWITGAVVLGVIGLGLIVWPVLSLTGHDVMCGDPGDRCFQSHGYDKNGALERYAPFIMIGIGVLMLAGSAWNAYKAVEHRRLYGRR